MVQDQAEANSELKQQKINYIEKLYNSNKRVADLESRCVCVHACGRVYIYVHATVLRVGYEQGLLSLSY